MSSSILTFPVVIHKDKSSIFGVTVPDLPGCFSAGETREAALENVVEAIEIHIEDMLEEGEEPSPHEIDDYRNKPRYSGGEWGLVDFDMHRVR